MVEDLCISRIQDKAQIMKLMLTSILSSECIPATRPRYQEPSSYSAQQACEKNNNDNIESDNIYPTYMQFIKKRCQATKKTEKDLECNWPPALKKGYFPLLFSPKKYGTSSFNFSYLYCMWLQLWNSPGQQKQTNKASCMLNFLCWNRIACKDTYMWILQSKLMSVMMLILKFKFRLFPPSNSLNFPLSPMLQSHLNWISFWPKTNKYTKIPFYKEKLNTSKRIEPPTWSPLKVLAALANSQSA